MATILCCSAGYRAAQRPEVVQAQDDVYHLPLAVAWIVMVEARMVHEESVLLQRWHRLERFGLPLLKLEVETSVLACSTWQQRQHHKKRSAQETQED